MKLVMDNSSVAIVGIALTSTLFAGAITNLESFFTNQEKREAIVEVQPRQLFIGASRYSPFVPEVYAIKPEEEELVLDWRALGSKYI